MDRPDREEEIRTLYRAHAQRVLAYALRRGASRADAEDLVIETFLICWRRWGEVSEPGLPWLLGVARRVLANQKRSAARQAALEKRLTESDAAAPSPEPASPPDHELLRSLGRLDEDDREVLLLVAWDGLTQSEAAQALGMSRTTFAARLERARTRLAKILEDPTAHFEISRTDIDMKDTAERRDAADGGSRAEEK
jgi:RNA polymerase sigma-70 factor (ECF subfamily)